MRRILRTLSFLLTAFRDLLMLILPQRIASHLITPGEFAFLVHPRHMEDAFKKYPFMQRLPKRIQHFIIRSHWPVILERFKGLTDIKGREITGYLVAIPLTPEYILKNPSLTQKKIFQAIKLAKRAGAKRVGLGALIPSATQGGELIRKKIQDIRITSGYALTVGIITEMVKEVIKKLHSLPEDLVIGIVGAAGYIGFPCTQILLQNRFREVLLIDKRKKLARLKSWIKESGNTGKNVKITSDVDLLARADIIITVTSAIEVIVRNDIPKPGAVIIDDTHPSNVDPSIRGERPDVLVLQVMATVPGIKYRFPLDQVEREDVYTCLAETILASRIEGEFKDSIGRVTVEQVREVIALAKSLGIKQARFRSFGRIVTEKDWARIRKIRKTISQARREHF